MNDPDNNERPQGSAMDNDGRSDHIIEELLKNPAASETVPLEDVKKLVENLHLHQAELKMQNEELRQAQQVIEEGRQKFADLYDFAPIGYVTLKDHTIVEANLTAAGLLGTKRDKLIGSPFFWYVQGDDKRGYLRHVMSVLGGRHKESIEVILRRFGGETFWAQLVSLPVEGMENSRNLMRVAIIDITPRKKIENALKASEEQYRELIESVNSIIVSVDTEGRVTFLNDYGRDILGYTSMELYTHGVIGTIVPPGVINPAEVASYIHYIAEHPDQYREREMEHIRRSGETLWVSWSIRVLHNSEGRFTGLLCVGNDITQRKKLEEEVRQAQKMEAIGTLAGGIAHDFNNILAAIIGFAEMIEEDLPPDSKSRRQVRKVLSAASRGADLVRQILAFSRKTDVAREPLHLAPIARETIQFLRASVPSTIEIELTIKAGKDVVLASPSSMQQVLMNLVTNAAAAMREAAGTIRIGINNIVFEPDAPVIDDVEPGEYVQITVEDTGTGMTANIMQRIFEPFFTTKEAGKGTGMGLAVVFGIVKRMGGTVTVESEAGEGSTFRVFLPIAHIEETMKSPDEIPIEGGSERILFIDDEELIVEWGKASLERLGYKVTALLDSTQALNAFSQNPNAFDLVIADQTMPGITGLNLAKKILSIQPDMPVILCTGHSEAVSTDKAKKAGIREFLMKPLSRAELANAIRRALGR